jgi:4-hydroxy-tetrahydrodipicolinate synthase
MENDYEKARQAHYKYLKMMDLCFIESNPAPVKSIMDQMGMIEEHLRLPLIPISPENAEILKAELKKLKFI